MKPDQLEILLQEGESMEIEFKQTFDTEALETIAAFANTKGGRLLIGVQDNGKPIGVTVGKETLRNWANQIAQSTGVHPALSEVSSDDKKIVLIEVPESPHQTVSYKGRYFKRVGNSNRRMSDDDLTRSILDNIGVTWDEMPDPRANVQDLDTDQIDRFISLCNQKGRRLIPEGESLHEILKKLDLLQDGQLTRAAILLFAKEPQRFYPSAKIRIGRFRSTTEIVDDREIRGTLYNQIESSMGYFREHLETKFEFRGESTREVIWEYPLDALREAVTNAVCHRDYLETGHTQIRWYDDHMVFFNPGGLPPSLDIEQLKQIHPSSPRNRKVAEMLYYAGLIEQWGRGIQKILSEFKTANLPEPEFEERAGGLWLTFRKNIFTEQYLRSLSLKKRQITAIFYLKAHGHITNKEYQELTNVSKRTASNDLQTLENKDLIERIGKTGRGTYYQLKLQRTGKTGNKGARNGQN